MTVLAEDLETSLEALLQNRGPVL
jgi:hypothetical protein